ncbi:unnamed protein product [Enterobius vermicularis]|uniref:Fibronectin type-III domain-containing protein n=1 Tax=Enterobius vermicularis TaxID=51028 RepID=A0A0N4VB18_ENTVE|nr:unnamed protein product [Enterobius vermicularis]
MDPSPGAEYEQYLFRINAYGAAAKPATITRTFPLAKFQMHKPSVVILGVFCLNYDTSFPVLYSSRNGFSCNMYV